MSPRGPRPCSSGWKTPPSHPHPCLPACLKGTDLALLATNWCQGQQEGKELLRHVGIVVKDQFSPPLLLPVTAGAGRWRQRLGVVGGNLAVLGLLVPGGDRETGLQSWGPCARIAPSATVDLFFRSVHLGVCPRSLRDEEAWEGPSRSLSPAQPCRRRHPSTVSTSSASSRQLSSSLWWAAAPDGPRFRARCLRSVVSGGPGSFSFVLCIAVGPNMKVGRSKFKLAC